MVGLVQDFLDYSAFHTDWFLDIFDIADVHLQGATHICSVHTCMEKKVFKVNILAMMQNPPKQEFSRILPQI